VQDLSPLKDLSRLASLDLTGTALQDLSGLEGLTNLTRLFLPSSVSDLRPLMRLTKLLSRFAEKITIKKGRIQIADLNTFSADDPTQFALYASRQKNLLKNTTSLNLRGCNSVSDLSPLKGLTTLTSLSLRECTAVRDINSLEELTTLTSLDLTHTSVCDISPLRGLKALTSLSLRGCTSVNNLSSLNELTKLKTLDLYGCLVNDLSPLRELPRLKTLNIQGTSVSSNEVQSLQSALPNLKIKR
jgi:internalin A